MKTILQLILYFVPATFLRAAPIAELLYLSAPWAASFYQAP